MKQTVEEAAREHQTHFEICDAEGTISGFINGVHKQSYESFISGAQWQSKQSPWISVKERLPEEGNTVLIRLKDGVIRLACYDIEEDSNIHFWNDNYAYELIGSWDVTHWCHIPYFDNNYKLSK